MSLQICLVLQGPVQTVQEKKTLSHLPLKIIWCQSVNKYSDIWRNIYKELMNLKITRRLYLIKGSLKTRQFGRSIEVPLVNIKEKNQRLIWNKCIKNKNHTQISLKVLILTLYTHSNREGYFNIFSKNW